MPDLKTRIATAATDLDDVVAQLSTLGSAVTVTATKDFYGTFTRWAQEMREAVQLLEARESSVRQFALLNDPAFHCRTNARNVLWNGESIPYWHARLMTFQSYLACTWSAYDTLAKVSGKLSLKESQAKDPSLNVNLINLLCRQKDRVKGDGIGFLFPSQLKEAYGWPIGFSYASRNWIMHEGHYQNGVALFDGDNRLVPQHRITVDAVADLKKRSETYDVQETNTLVTLPNPQDDLLAYLKLCHEEIDLCAGILLSWTCSAAKQQATLILQRFST
jgi:uncharacterized protein YukE